MKRFFCWLLCALALLFAGSAAGARAESGDADWLALLNEPGRSVGVEIGTLSAYDAESAFPNAEIKVFNNPNDGLMSVERGVIDAFAGGRTTLEYAIASGALKGVKLLDINVGGETQIVAGISPQSQFPGIREKINAFLKTLREDGTMDEIYDRWIHNPDQPMPEIPVPENPDSKLVVGTTGLVVPYSFYRGTELTGMDLEIIYRLAYALNAELEIKVFDFYGIMTALEMGQVDCVFSNLNATKEREETMIFSDPVYVTHTALVVRDGETGDKPAFQSMDELNQPGIRLGAQVGTTFDVLMTDVFPNAKVQYYNTIADMAYHVSVGGLDAFAADEPVARILIKAMPEVTYMREKLEDMDYAFVFPKTESGKALCDQLSAFIREIKADGTLERVRTAWVEDDRSAQTWDRSVLTGENGVLSLATECSFQPFSYIRDNGPVGMDLDILIRFCQKYGYRLEVHDMSFEAVIPSLSSMCDLGGSGISVTEERKEQVYFSETYYAGGTVMVVRNNAAVEKESFWTSVVESFKKTFIRENRWVLILRGIGTTVYISVFAVLIGTALGFGLCMLRRLKNPVTRALTTGYIRILQGTPLVVFLMILFYVVFAGSGVSGEWVAIFAFALNFAAYACEIIRGGVESVDKGQTEAALAIGFTRAQTFFRIVMPQAMRQFLPVYKGEFISLVKMTSIVGYIAVEDLTKMSDIIRARTYEAFFPLIATAVLYFVIAGILGALLRVLEKKITPKRSHRAIRGVKTA